MLSFGVYKMWIYTRTYYTLWFSCQNLSLQCQHVFPKHWKQYTQLNSAHNMNNILSRVITLSVIALKWVAPVKRGLLLKWPNINFVLCKFNYHQGYLIFKCLAMNVLLNHFIVHELHIYNTSGAAGRSTHRNADHK